MTRVAPERMRQFHESGDLDIAYTAEGLPRFRVNVFRQRGAISFAFRVIPRDVPSFERLSMPPGVARLANEHRGLVLVTGATGSGKTTTLASMLDHINRTRSQHIVTIEDPIEILHPDRSSIVNQREVGLDTESFAQALRRVLRQDPDMILIGELRDAETAQTALQAAESGHLVFSTLHTIDAAETVGRMIEFFPPAKQQQIRSVLAGVLRGVISQRLLPRVDHGRVAAVEVMVMNARISDLIREQRTEEIADAVAEGGFFDMQTFEQALIELVLAGKVEREVAANAATNVHDFHVALDHALKRQTVEVAQEEAAEAAGRGGGRTLRLSASSAPRRRDATAHRGVAARPRARRRKRVRGHVRRRPRQFVALPETRWRCRAPRCRTRPARSCCRPEPGRRRSCPSASSPTRSCSCSGSHAGAAYGIPWQVLAAINKIESNFGRNMGPSSAGAVGWMQFMPDTWLRWGTDGNGDGIADPWNPDDAIYSAARYLAAADGRTDISRAIFAYNHAQWYVDDVLQLAAMFGGDVASADAVFTLDRMALALEQAQERWPRSPSSSTPPRRPSPSRPRRRSGSRPRRGPRTAALRPLLAEKDAFQAGEELAAATAEADRLRDRAGAGAGRARDRPERRRIGVVRARRRRRPADADAGGRLRLPGRRRAGRRLRRPSPSRLPRRRHRGAAGRAGLRARRRRSCSRSSTTAAAAPASSSGPLDGLEWVYCHLSYRDPGLEAGLVVTAGQWVGLVGSTGHSTGPHLHLGLRPARYPQEMPWFQEFAGIAFTWQDEPAEAEAPIDAGLRARSAGGAGRGRRRIHTLGGLSSCLLLPTDAV